MKRTLLLLALVIGMSFAAGGYGLAADSPAGQDSSSSRQQTHRTAPGLSAEAPWISLALANSQSIGLSAEQQRNLETLPRDYQERASHHLESIEKADADLQLLLSAPSIDLDKVRTALSTTGALNASARLSRIETLIKGRAVLSADQKAKLQTLLDTAEYGTHGPMMRQNRGPGDCYRESK